LATSESTIVTKRRKRENTIYFKSGSKIRLAFLSP